MDVSAGSDESAGTASSSINLAANDSSDGYDDDDDDEDDEESADELPEGETEYRP